MVSPCFKRGPGLHQLARLVCLRGACCQLIEKVKVQTQVIHKFNVPNKLLHKFKAQNELELKEMTRKVMVKKGDSKVQGSTTTLTEEAKVQTMTTKSKHEDKQTSQFKL